MLSLLPSVLALLAIFTPPAPRAVLPNANVLPAGQLSGSVLRVTLVAEVGTWYPHGPRGAAIDVAAFGVEGDDLSSPGPLIRVREGTLVVATVRNRLSAPLRLHGLCTRPDPCAAIVIPPGGTQEVRFSLDVAGTYFYWGSTGAETLASRPRRESQLGGAIVVDPREGGRNDRVMVISLLDDPPRISAEGPADAPVFAINGASWPHTERLRYSKGERVHWRVINLSFDSHAMHLHGFHFDLESKGNIDADRLLLHGQTRAQVTEQMAPGTTFTLSWTPTRGGNWIFHCHMVAHMMAKSKASHADHGSEAAGMAGLVMGIQVAGGLDEKAASTVPKRFTMVLREERNRYGSHPGYRIDVEGIEAPRLDAGPVPGPVLVLERGAPVEINVVNQLSEPSAIHWHGIELDSYFDGVPGFGGKDGAIAPPIVQGATFVAKFSPPRAGTFIYHTHWHDEAQLAGGLYGALIVLEPGEQYDPATDHIILIGLNGVLTAGTREPFALNGRAAPGAVTVRVGVPNRLRFINITPNNVALTVSLEDRFETVMWKPVAKDGAVLVPEQTAPGVARQLITVGETYDFEITPSVRQNLWLNVKRGNGEWVMQARIVVR